MKLKTRLLVKSKADILIPFLLVIGNICFGQTPGAGKQKININQVSLNKKLDSLFSQFDSKKAPGFAITIIQNGKHLLDKSYSMASIELRVPFTHNSIVSIPYCRFDKL